MSANSIFRHMCRSCEFCFPMETELHICPLDCFKPSPGGVGEVGVALEGLRQLLHSEAHREQLRRRAAAAAAAACPDPNLDDDGRLGGSSSCRSRAALLPAHGQLLSPPPPVWPDKSSAATWSASGAPRTLVSSADAAERLKTAGGRTPWPPLAAPRDPQLLPPPPPPATAGAGDKFLQAPQTRRKAKLHLSKIRRSSQ